MNHIQQGFLSNDGRWRIKYDDNENAGYYYSSYVSDWMPLPKTPKS
jgi:hypothetical protein